MNLKKQEPRRRKPVFREFPEIGALALKAGLGTVGELAEATGKHHNTVTRLLRGEIEAPLAEKAIAEKLGVSVGKLRSLRNPQTQAKAA